MVAVGQYNDPTIPKEAGMVHATRGVMLEQFLNLFENWEPIRQALPINYGPTAMVLAGAVPGTLLVTKLDKIFNLKTISPGLSVRLLTIIPSACVPAIMCGLLHQKLVTEDILLRETSCPVCVDTRAAAIQTSLSVGMGSFFALTGSAVLLKFCNARTAPNTKKEFQSLMKKTVPKVSNILIGCLVFELACASLVVFLEQSSYLTVISELDRRMAEADALKIEQ